jgi:hypothetical protein
MDMDTKDDVLAVVDELVAYGWAVGRFGHVSYRRIEHEVAKRGVRNTVEFLNSELDAAFSADQLTRIA